MTSDPAIILAAALPGREITAGRRFKQLQKKVPQAWKLWRTTGIEWAVFSVVGEHLSEIDQEGVTAAHAAGLRPILIVPGYLELKAIAPHYQTMRPFLAYEIAGTGCLIPPPQISTNYPPAVRTPDITRIPPALLAELAGLPELPRDLSRLLRKLSRHYTHFIRGRDTYDDSREEKILLGFATEVLEQMGLPSDKIRATQFVRTLEGGGLGARRDHFFHSFQNFFLGLLAVAKLRPRFEAYKDAARIHWDVDPFHVWFLTALWHDVGYSLQKFDNVIHAALGFATNDITNYLKQEWLTSESMKDALVIVSSLISRLLKPGTARSEWMPPSRSSNLGSHAMSVQNALSANVRRSHGAVGALRLFCDYNDDLDKMEPEKRDLLKQTVLIACSSIPFHDWSFRADLHDACGRCRFAANILPFAALLAFVDSIQDDRRDLTGAKDVELVLERLLISEPATIEAQINMHALASGDLLNKIVEARDVVAALDQTEGGLFFKYPEWMVGAHG